MMNIGREYLEEINAFIKSDADQKYIVRDDRGEEIMVAPLRTIARAFRFEEAAQRRIIIEGDSKKGAQMHFNNRLHDITGQSAYITVHKVQGQH